MRRDLSFLGVFLFKIIWLFEKKSMTEEKKKNPTAGKFVFAYTISHQNTAIQK